MTCEEDIEVASVRDEDNEEPDEEKAGVLSLGAIDEQEGAGQREEDAKENLVMKKRSMRRKSFSRVTCQTCRIRGPTQSMPGLSSHWLRPTTEMMARMREMARWKKPNPKTAFWRGIPKKELMHMIVLQNSVLMCAMWRVLLIHSVS